MVFLVPLNVAAQWVIWPLTFLRVVAPSSASTDPYEICGNLFHDDHPLFCNPNGVNLEVRHIIGNSNAVYFILFYFIVQPFMREMLQDSLDK